MDSSNSFFPKLKVVRLHKDAKLPEKGSEHAAGYDLASVEDTVVEARGKKLIATGLSMAIPIGNYGRVAPRSGLSVKNSIHTGAGVIDADYRGEVKVLLYNLSDVDFQVNVGDRIAQLIIEKYTRTDVEEVTTLDETVRGEGGFGSTGIKALDLNKENIQVTKERSSSKKRKISDLKVDGESTKV